MANIFLGEDPLVIGSFLPVRWIARPMMRRFLTKTPARPGASFALLDEREPMPEVPWAGTNSIIRRAFGSLLALVNELAAESVASPTRRVVSAAVARWKGEDMGLSTRWIEPHLVEVPEADRAEARLGLLTALSSHHVDETVIRDFRRTRPSDRALLILTSWASALAASRIGSWL
jgi:hypothetical protein